MSEVGIPGGGLIVNDESILGLWLLESTLSSKSRDMLIYLMKAQMVARYRTGTYPVKS